VSDDTLAINGWTVYAHPLFLDQLEAIIVSVENARKKDPKGYKKKRAAKLLSAVLKVAFEDIPSDPTRYNYRQGGTLGEEYKHWFRAKFLQQFRLFFRYQQTEGAKIIVLAWVNDDSTLRASLARRTCAYVPSLFTESQAAMAQASGVSGSKNFIP
jgi:toxin YhaV